MFKKWAKLRVKSNVNQFLSKKRHKKGNQECKQKQSRFFNFSNIFGFLTSKTEKMHGESLLLNLIFTYFSIMNNSEKIFKKNYWQVFIVTYLLNKCNHHYAKTQFITVTQCGFIAPHVWEIVCTKNITIFKGCHYSRFYIMISLNFQKMETKNLNSDPRILIFLVLRTTSPAAY